MEPRESFITELVILAVIFTVMVARFWVIRHQRRGPEDWVRDIFFGISAVLCMATTSCLAWYCWKSIGVYEQATIIVDGEMAEAAKNSTIDLTSMTPAQLEALQAKLQLQRDTSIEGLATVMLLDSWYRRFLFFIWGGYFTELWLLKGAFLAFYWRLFSRVQTRFVYLLYGTTAIVTVTYIIVLTIHFAWCTPVHRNWTIPLEEFPSTSSINSLTTLTIGSFLNIGTDLLIIILPLLVIQSFKLRRREKLGLCFIFTVGIVCVTASVVRYINMYLPYKSPPATMDGVRVSFLWSTLEVMTGFIAFCLPSFRLVLFRAFKRGKSTIMKRRRSTGPHGGVYSSQGISDPNPHSLGSSGARSKKKNLPRHPNTLLTVDFVTLNTIISRDDDALPFERDNILCPPSAITRGIQNIQTRIGILPDFPQVYNEASGIQVTNTISISSAPADPVDGRQDGIPMHYTFPPVNPNINRRASQHQHIHQSSYDSGRNTTPTSTPPPVPFPPVPTIEATDDYPSMPIQRAYDPSTSHTSSQENLRPNTRDGHWAPGQVL